MKITSLQNPRVKELVRLRQGRKRRQTGEFLIDGQREVHRAMLCHFPVRQIFYVPELVCEEAARWLEDLQQNPTGDVTFFEVTPQVFEKIAYGEREDGVLAVADYVETTLDALWDKVAQKPAATQAVPLIGVIEGVEKPGNIGAILRSADGSGLSALIVAEPQTDLFNPNTIRASLGTIFSIPVCTASSEDVVAFLKSHGLEIYAAIVEGSIPYTEADFTKPAAIVLGSEAWGLTSAFRTEGIHPIALPMLGIADSLNVSTTAAILFYEALRQRTSR